MYQSLKCVCSLWPSHSHSKNLSFVLILDVHKDLTIRVFVFNRIKFWNSWSGHQQVMWITKNKTSGTGVRLIKTKYWQYKNIHDRFLFKIYVNMYTYVHTCTQNQGITVCFFGIVCVCVYVYVLYCFSMFSKFLILIRRYFWSQGKKCTRFFFSLFEKWKVQSRKQ